MIQKKKSVAIAGHSINSSKHDWMPPSHKLEHNAPTGATMPTDECGFFQATGKSCRAVLIFSIHLPGPSTVCRTRKTLPLPLLILVFFFCLSCFSFLYVFFSFFSI